LVFKIFRGIHGIAAAQKYETLGHIYSRETAVVAAEVATAFSISLLEAQERRHTSGSGGAAVGGIVSKF